MVVADFDKSITTSADFLMPFAVTLTREYEDAKDLYQETLLRALANKNKYTIGTNLKAWLFTIMRNIFINDYHRRIRQQVIFDATVSDYFINSTQAVTFNAATSSLNLKEIHQAILNLPDIFKTPFILYFDGYKYKEIADMLCEPAGTIKSRIHFARKLLRAKIERF